MASYDKDGNYIPTKGDILNDKVRLRNTQFQKDVELFLNKHNIKGEPYSYGLATTNPNEVSEKLQRLGIKFKLDYTPNFHTKVIISKNQKLI